MFVIQFLAMISSAPAIIEDDPPPRQKSLLKHPVRLRKFQTKLKFSHTLEDHLSYRYSFSCNILSHSKKSKSQAHFSTSGLHQISSGGLDISYHVKVSHTTRSTVKSQFNNLFSDIQNKAKQEFRQKLFDNFKKCILAVNVDGKILISENTIDLIYKNTGVCSLFGMNTINTELKFASLPKEYGISPSQQYNLYLFAQFCGDKMGRTFWDNNKQTDWSLFRKWKILHIHPPQGGNGSLKEPVPDTSACTLCSETEVELRPCPQCGKHLYCGFGCRSRHWKLHHKSHCRKVSVCADCKEK